MHPTSLEMGESKFEERGQQKMIELRSNYQKVKKERKKERKKEKLGRVPSSMPNPDNETLASVPVCKSQLLS